METFALAALVGSAVLVAVTITFCSPMMDAGAVYRPVAEMVPTAVFSVQTTLCCDVPVIIAVNCRLWAGARVRLAGATLTAMTATAGGGLRVTVAQAVFV